MAMHIENIRKRLLSGSGPDGDCVVWTGAMLGKHHYGGLKVAGVMCYAHRLSYEINKGEIPSGMVVMHKCDRPQCINPDHLELGTQADNVADMHAKRRNKPTIGELNGMSKLTGEQVAAIRARYVSYCRKNGARPMAREYGVTHQTISSITRGDSWASAQ
jgi:hypothetical protein